MARSTGLVALRSARVDFADVAASVLLIFVLGVLIMWPLFDVLVDGLIVVPVLLPFVGITLAVAGAATVAALGMAAVVVAAVRFGVSGRDSLAGIHRAGVLVP